LRIEKIHKILEFDQSPWLKPYIDLNTNLRTKARNSFEKDFYKLMNNSVFGRTMMNVRKHVDIRLITNATQLEKLIAKPNFDRATIFTENLAAIHMKRTSTKLFQPVYVGMTILDISKKLMYDFYYNVLKEKYGDKIRLLYCDTDSLIIEVKTNDFYQDMKNDINHYDTSDYPLDNIYNIPLVNKKVIGKFKDELNGKIMAEFIGLRSKLYSFAEHSTGKEVKKAKGVKKYVVDKEICHNDFKKCLSTQKSLSIKQNIFRTKKHDICTIEQNKTALSAHDDKRFILENGIDTLAWGYYKTEISRENFIGHINNIIKTNNSKN